MQLCTAENVQVKLYGYNTGEVLTKVHLHHTHKPMLSKCDLTAGWFMDWCKLAISTCSSAILSIAHLKSSCVMS